jgi:hypothetical protein
VCGKFLTSYLAEFGKYGSSKFEIDKSNIVFIQIIDTKKFPKKSTKEKQLNDIN